MSAPRFEDRPVRAVPDQRGFRLDKANGKLMGVSAGMAERFGWNVTLVRLAWVIGTLLGFGSLIVIYLAIGLLAD